MIQDKRTSVGISLPSSLLKKARNLIDTMPGQNLSLFLESILEREIAAYEEEYGDIDPAQDLYFHAVRRTRRARP